MSAQVPTLPAFPTLLLLSRGFLSLVPRKQTREVPGPGRPTRCGQNLAGGVQSGAALLRGDLEAFAQLLLITSCSKGASLGPSPGSQDPSSASYGPEDCRHVNFISLCLSFFIYKMKTKMRPCMDYWDGRGDAEGYRCSSAEPGAKQARLGRIHSSLPGEQCLHSILQRE